MRVGVLHLFTPNAPVSVLSRKVDQAIDRRSLVFRCEMGVPHDHLECPVPEQLCNRAQINPGHSKSTGKRMAVAMSRVSAIGRRETSSRRGAIVAGIERQTQ